LGGAFTWATETDNGFSINGVRYEIEGLLGEGSFGSVYRCLSDGQAVAVKVLSTERIAVMTNCSQEVVLRRMLQEAEILGCLGGHPNIVRLECAAVSQQTLRIYIVMQLLDCGDLFSEMLRRRQALSERDAREVLTQVVMAVFHCHRRGVAHRDIKLENVMLSSRKPMVVKLIDFGQAILPDQNKERMRSIAKTVTTTSVYTPPEVQKATEDNEPYDAFKLDAFAVGVVLYALLLSALPQTSKGLQFDKHPKFKYLSPQAQDLIKQLMDPDPQQRISMADALQHPWLSMKGSSSGLSRASSTHTPVDRDGEMQVLLTTQELFKALQRERGSSCWLLSGSAEAENVCHWFCKSTDEIYVNLQERLSFVQVEDYLTKQVCEMAEVTTRLRLEVRNLKNVPRGNKQDNFDTVFSGYSKLTDDAIDLLGEFIVAFKGDMPLNSTELKLKISLHIAEQLGRERGFISFHIGRPELLHSVQAQLRFAKIQGCRQYLLGSTRPYVQAEVMSKADGLLPTLRLAEEPLLSAAELQALEAAETSVMQGQRNTAEWFSFLTGLIDKVHQTVSMTIVSFIQEISVHKTPVEIHAVPSMSDMSKSSTPAVLVANTSPYPSASPYPNSGAGS